MSYLPPTPTATASINALGDSISAQSILNPTMAPPATFPAWAASTAYALNQCVANVGYAFRCSTAGTSAASGGPAPSTSSITDGGVVWQQMPAVCNKDSFVGWAEAFSQGLLHFDQLQGYAGPQNTLRRVIVANGGSNYSNTPTVVLNQGASGTATVVGGVVTAVTLTNPGYGSGGFQASITDSTGTGAVLSPVQDGSGTFGVGGCRTGDMVARLPDALASNVSIFTVQGGRNDIVGTPATLANSAALFASITGNLRTTYETLINAGRCVIVIPVLPCSAFGAVGSALATRVNRWIRAYVRQLAWANPSAYARIALADATKALTDGTVLTSFWPVGGTGGTAAAVTIDGTHPNERGRIYLGAAVWQAAQKFTGPAGPSTPRVHTAADGYDVALNPGGNLLEAFPWAASTACTVGQLRANNGNVYRCTTAGTTGATGPSGTGSGLTDGTAQWAYVRPVGMSVLGSGTNGTLTAATNITYSGALAGGFTLVRGGGSASGTVTAAVESPWSDGTVGQRQTLAFSLNSGTASEQWVLRAIYGAYGAFGVLASDLASTPFYAEAEVELSGLANLSSLNLMLADPSIGWYAYGGGTDTGAAARLPTAADVFPLPNNGRLLLRTTRLALPANLAQPGAHPGAQLRRLGHRGRQRRRHRQGQLHRPVPRRGGLGRDRSHAEPTPGGSSWKSQPCTSRW